jgi:hypothetical protein
MTPARRQQLDRLCRRIRNGAALWGDEGPAREEKADRVLHKARSRLAPIEKEENRARMNEIFERRYSIDTAIYYS